MERNRIQTVLRKQFFFRVAVLLIAAIGFILYVCIKYDWWLQIKDLVLGICGSAFVWALVEIFDFFVKTYSQYCSERSEYLLTIEKTFNDIIEVLKKNREGYNWKEVHALVKDIYKFSCKYPYNSEVFVLSKEFFEVHSYLERMYWKLTATEYLSYIPKDRDYYKNITFNMFIKVENETEDDIGKVSEDSKELRKTWKEIAEIPLNFECFKIPSKAVKLESRGNISYTFSHPQDIHTYVTFIPSMDFENVYDKKINGAMITVFRIIFRTIEEYDKNEEA